MLNDHHKISNKVDMIGHKQSYSFLWGHKNLCQNTSTSVFLYLVFSCDRYKSKLTTAQSTDFFSIMGIIKTNSTDADIIELSDNANNTKRAICEQKDTTDDHRSFLPDINKANCRPILKTAERSESFICIRTSDIHASVVTRASRAFEKVSPGCSLTNLYILKILFLDILISVGDTASDVFQVQ